MEVGWFALLVSIAALALTWWNFRRATKKDRVFWVQRDKVSRSGDRASTWHVIIRNYGHGAAGDVRLFLMHQFLAEPAERRTEPTVSLGQDTGTSVAVDDMSNQTLESLAVIVKWRQAPNFEKDRVQVFRFPMAKKHEGTGV